MSSLWKRKIIFFWKLMSLQTLSRWYSFSAWAYPTEKNQSFPRIFQKCYFYKNPQPLINKGQRDQIKYSKNESRSFLYIYWWKYQRNTCRWCSGWPKFQDFIPSYGIKRRSSISRYKIFMKHFEWSLSIWLLNHHLWNIIMIRSKFQIRWQTKLNFIIRNFIDIFVRYIC